MTLVLCVETVLILLLLGALLYGQPESARQDRDQLAHDRSTIATLQGRVPSPTPHFCLPDYTC